MKRGDLVTVADRGGDYTGKPRPALVVQSDIFPDLSAIALCPLTSLEKDADILRLRLLPGPGSSLRSVSYVQIDKLTTARRDRIGAVIGSLSGADMQRVDRALALFLGLV